MDGLNSQNAKRDQHRPIERAKAVLRENPDLKKREVMEKANVGSKVAVNARREIAAEPPPTREEPKRMSPDNDREFAAWLWRKAGREDLTLVIEWLGATAIERVAWLSGQGQHERDRGGCPGLFSIRKRRSQCLN
jgi:hypothetical protein